MKPNKYGFTKARFVYDAKQGKCVKVPIDYDVPAPLPEGASCLSRSDHWRHHESLGLACHPMQVNEFNEKAKRARTGAVYQPDGKCRLTSSGGLKKELKHRNFVNNDGIS